MKPDSAPTAETIRRALGIYTDPDAPLFRGQGFAFTVIQFLLRSACLSLEVFLRSRFGKRYLTIPKLIVSSFFPALCLFLANFDSDFKVGFSLIQPGFVELIQPNVERLSDSISKEIDSLQSELKQPQAELPAPLTRQELEKALLEAQESAPRKGESEHPPSIFRRSVNFLKALADPASREHLLAGFSVFLAVFGLVANLKLTGVYLNRILSGSLGFREAPPHSSGEPWLFFNPLYRLAQRFNAKTDMVKQFAEPLLCYLLGAALQNELSPAYSFISTWLKLGAFLVFVRMYLENRNREKLHLDGLSNKLNAEAIQLQNSLLTAKDSTIGLPVQVQGK